MAQVEVGTIAAIVVAVIGAGGIGGAIVAFIKAKPEASKILIEAAGEVVVIQKGTIEHLQEEISDLRIRLDQADGLRDRVSELERHLARAERENKRLSEENAAQKVRIVELEARVNQLESGT
jgi:predicted RNase H-like nuclease (RuvC/YqgF family)